MAIGDDQRQPTFVYMIMEAKVDIGGAGDSAFQGAAYHLRFWSHGRTSSAVFGATTCPALLLEVRMRLQEALCCRYLVLSPGTYLWQGVRQGVA